MNGAAESERPGSVEPVECSKCGWRKGRAEFYPSELKGVHRRCKQCCRGRVANQRSGRSSNSMTPREAKWLGDLCRALPSSDLRTLARRPEYGKFVRMATAGVAKGVEAKRVGDAEQETD